MISNTPKTDWTASDGVSTEDMNQIEQNIQDLEDSKLENVEGTVDLSGGLDDNDVTLRFASDAAIEWDEVADKFTATKPFPVSVLSVPNRGTAITITSNGLYTVPRGVWEVYNVSASSTFRITFSAGTESTIDGVSGDIIVSDGTNVKINITNSGSVVYFRLYKVL